MPRAKLPWWRTSPATPPGPKAHRIEVVVNAIPAEPCSSGSPELERALPIEAVTEEAVKLLKGFADPTRLRILALLRMGEVCVHQLVEALDMSQSAVSHQLRTLRSARLVTFTKRGRHVYYRLVDDHVRDILDSVLSHSEELWFGPEQEPWSGDQQLDT